MPFAIAPDGTEIAYHARGTGVTTLIFLHAWGASGGYFDDMIEHLDPSICRSITMDLRGHGDSGKPDVDLSWDLLARDVLAVMDAAQAPTFVAVGHSLGGKLAQYLPLVASDRVRALVLVASPSAGPLPAPDFVRAWVDLAGDGDALTRDSVERFLRAPVPNERLRRFARDAAKIPRNYLARTLDLVATTSFLERLAGIELPVLIVSTAEDPVHTTENQITASLPQARTIEIDSGSEIPMERPAELARIVQSFVTELT